MIFFRLWGEEGIMEDIYTRIDRGDFKPKTPYPTKPKKPSVLRKVAGDLTENELQMLPRVKREYEDALAACELQRKQHLDEVVACERAFEEALAAEHGVTDHPKRALLYGKACDRGHSGGHSDTASIYSDLVELIL
jgi:hypothetical protein